MDAHQILTLALASPAFLGWAATLGDPTPYTPAGFHHRIAQDIVEVLEGRLDVLIVETGVQMGKSELCSVLTPALALGLNPERSVIVASYASDFIADRAGRRVRDFIERHGAAFFSPQAAIDPSSNARDRFNTLAGGGMLTVGVDKGVAGRRADLVVIDDPYPGVEEAMSAAHRAKVWSWYQHELATRLAPGAGQILVQSRWHEEDFTAQMIEHCRAIGVRYKVVDMPALAVCKLCGSYGVNAIDECGHGDAGRDDLGRLPGEELWAVRNREFLLTQRKIVGSRAFDALYQARPRAEEGTTFLKRWFKYATLENDDAGRSPILRLRGGASVRLDQCHTFAMVDLAFTQNASSDYFVIGVFALTPGLDLVLLDVIRTKATTAEQVRLIKAAMVKWPISRVGIEVVAAQAYMFDMLLAEGLPVRPIKATSAKTVRAEVAAARFEAGQVYMMTGTSWLDDCERELLAFPSGKHDDVVDVIAMASSVVAEVRVGGAAPTSLRPGGIPLTDGVIRRPQQFVTAGATRLL